MFRPETLISTQKTSVRMPKTTSRTVEARKMTLAEIPQRLKSRRRKSRVSVQLAIA